MKGRRREGKEEGNFGRGRSIGRSAVEGNRTEGGGERKKEEKRRFGKGERLGCEGSGREK